MKEITIKKSQIKNQIFIFLILVFVFIPPYFIQIVSKYKILNDLISMTSITLIVYYLFKEGIKINLPIIILGIEYIFLLLSTIMNKGLFNLAFSNAIFTILLCLMLSNLIENSKRLSTFLHMVRDVTVVIFIMNCFLAIVMPRGIPSITTGDIPNFLYGNMNSTIKYIFPGLGCSLIIDYLERKKISIHTVIFFVGMFYFNINVYFMATAAIAMLFIIMWLLFRKLINRNPKLVFIILLCVIFLIQVTVVMQFGNQFLGNFIADIFGKSITFSGRSFLWTNCIFSIVKKPLLGHGLVPESLLHALVGNSAGAHNYYLDIVFQRGIVGLSIFIFFILYILKKMEWKTPLRMDTYILLGICSAYLIMFLSEPFYNTEKFHIPIFYILGVLLNRKSNLNKEKHNVTQKVS